MSNTKTLIFQHLHRTGGTTLFSIMRRYFDRDAVYRIDEFRNAEKYSVEHFLSLSQEERDKIKLLRGHLPFGMHAYFSHPCDYITILRDPVDRVVSEYSRLALWDDRAHIKNFEKLEGMSFHDFVNGNLAAVRNYQTRVLSGNWVGQYEEATPLGEDALREAKNNLKKYCFVVGVTDKLDETIVVLAKAFGWRNPYYFERRNVAKRTSDISPGDLEIIRDNNTLDSELYRFARELLEESIRSYGPNFQRDFRRFRLVNKVFGALVFIVRRFPDFLRRPIRQVLGMNISVST